MRKVFLRKVSLSICIEQELEETDRQATDATLVQGAPNTQLTPKCVQRLGSKSVASINPLCLIDPPSASKIKVNRSPAALRSALKEKAAQGSLFS